MSDFFTKSDGSDVKPIDSFENAGGNFKLIPEGTKLVAAILSAEWVDEEVNKFSGDLVLQHIVVTSVVTDKGEYSGVTTKHKLHVFHDDGKKADKAKDMLMAYDTNIKGHIEKLRAAKKFTVGDSEQINRALAGGNVLLTYAVYEMNDRTGNWVRAVESAKAKKPEPVTKEPDFAPELPDDEYDPEIPF